MVVTLTREQVAGAIEGILTDLLQLEAGRIIKPTDTLRGLGMESPLVYLELECQLAKMFGIRLAHGEFFPSNDQIAKRHRYLVGGHFDEGRRFVPGTFTLEGVKQIRLLFPWGDFEEFEKNPTEETFFTLYTFKAVVEFIVRKIGVVPDQPVQPSISRWISRTRY